MLIFSSTEDDTHKDQNNLTTSKRLCLVLRSHLDDDNLSSGTKEQPDFAEELQSALASNNDDNDTTIKLTITLPKPTTTASVNQESPSSALSFPWQHTVSVILRQIPNHRIVELHITCHFDCQGKHGMPISTLTYLMETCPNLQTLTLHTVGFQITSDVAQWDLLQSAFQSHAHLQAVSMMDIYFCAQPQPSRCQHYQHPVERERPQTTSIAWLQCSHMVTAIAHCRMVRQVQVAPTTRFFTRPIVTLASLSELLRHSSLRKLSVANVVLYGSDNIKRAALCLQHNTRLQHLTFQNVVFAGSQDNGSLLQGLQGNTSLRTLILQSSRLPLWEAEGFITALQQQSNLTTLSNVNNHHYSTQHDKDTTKGRSNTGIQRLVLTQTGWGVNEQDHYTSVCQILAALPHHLIGLEWNDLLNNVSVEPWVQRILNLLTGHVNTNRSMTHLCIDDDARNKTTTRTSPLHVWSQYEKLHFAVDLNRSGYWNLSQASSLPMEWLQAMLKVHDNESCVFFLLRDNPLLIMAPSSEAVMAKYEPNHGHSPLEFPNS